MPRTFIVNFSESEAVDEVFLVQDVQARSNRNGAEYLSFDLCDRTGVINAKFWNATTADIRQCSGGDYVSIRGKVQIFQGRPQLIVQSFRRVDASAIDPADFIANSPVNVETLERELRSRLQKIVDPAAQALAQAVLIDEDLMSRFCRAPAGIRNHHAYLGGLLEHVVSLLRLAEKVSEVYANLDLDLLRLGVLWHDLGKVRELAFDQAFSYTDEGQLIGHLVIGVEMLNEKRAVAEQLLGEPIGDELMQRLKHMILSHHGEYAFGSPKLPMTIEGMALHYLDNLDAKMHVFTKAMADDANPAGNWTAYDPSLQRRLFKTRPTEPLEYESS